MATATITETPGVPPVPNGARTAEANTTTAEPGAKGSEAAKSVAPAVPPEIARRKAEAAQAMVDQLERMLKAQNEEGLPVSPSVLESLARYGREVDKWTSASGVKEDPPYDPLEPGKDPPPGGARGQASGGEADLITAEQQGDHTAGIPKVDTEPAYYRTHLSFLGRWLHRKYHKLRPRVDSLIRNSKFIQDARRLAYYIGKAHYDRVREEDERDERRADEKKAQKNKGTAQTQQTEQPVAEAAPVQSTENTAATEQANAQPAALQQIEQQHSQISLGEKAIKEIATYGIGLTGSEDPKLVINQINKIIAERNKQPGNDYKIPWEIDKEETLNYVKEAIDLTGERSQSTVQQKT